MTGMMILAIVTGLACCMPFVKDAYLLNAPSQRQCLCLPQSNGSSNNSRLIGMYASVRRGNQYVEDPYTKARFQMECSGKISPIGNLAIIGAGASGLMCSHTQTR